MLAGFFSFGQRLVSSSFARLNGVLCNMLSLEPRQGGDKIGSFAFEKRNWSGFFTIFKGLWTGLICSHSKSFRELKNVIKYGFCLYLGGLKIGGPNGAKQF